MTKKKIYKIYCDKGRKGNQQKLSDDYSFGEQYDSDKMPSLDDGAEEVSSIGQLVQMVGLSADHPLINFYVEDKAAQFVAKYQPCNERDPMAICFTDSKLRSYFKSYVCTYGDPLKIYLMRLRLAGFSYSTDITGDLVLLVKEREFLKGDMSWMQQMEESCDKTESSASFVIPKESLGE